MKKQILIIGEHPEINPKAKSLFISAMENAGWKEEDFKWINVLRESPGEGKNITKTMINNARERLLKKVEKINPSFILLLGNAPCQALIDQTGIRKLRGKPIEFNRRVVLPILHPNQALYDEKWSDIVEADLGRLKECVEFGGIPEERSLDFEIVDTWPKVNNMLSDLHGEISVDLETSRLYPFYTEMDKLIESGRASKAAKDAHRATHGSNNLPRIISMQFGCEKKQWIVPLETAGIWTPKEQKKIVKLVTKKLKKCKETIFHNGKFDCLWIRTRFGIKWTVGFDTMLAHYLLDENDFHDLKYLAQKYLGAPDWDIDGKEKTSWSPKNAKYGAHDVFYTRALAGELKKLLWEDEDVRQVYYWIIIPCIKLFIESEYNGVQINLDKMDDAEAYLREQLSEALNNLEKWGKKASKVDKKTGKINWGSSDQLANLLFTDLRIKSIEKTKGGKDSVSESVLLRIDHPMVGDLLKFRAAQKQLSSFIEGWRPYLGINGRLHPSFKLHGTVTGRLSCEQPNLQQVPRDPRIRSLITAPPGWVLIEMDLSQIELRIAAELADEHNMLQAFHTGVDVHWLTAIREIERGAGYKKEMIETARLSSGKKMSYSEAVEYILQMGPDDAKKLMDMWGEVRKKAKAINFGYLYGMWWKKFKIYARDNYGVEVTDLQAQESRESFFELYPRLVKWHDKQKRFAQINGYVRSPSGRKRRLPKAMSGRDSPERREALRQAINSPVQSFANELNLMAAIQMRKEFSWNWFRICGTIHDAILMIVRLDKVKHVWYRGLEIMSRPALMDDFDIEFGVPIEAEAKVGAWGIGTKDIESWLKENC